MKRYLYGVVGLIIFYALFFYGESINIGAHRVIDSQPFFPALFVVLPLPFLLIPFLRRRPTAVIVGAGVGVYLLFTTINLPSLNFSDRGTILGLIIEVFSLLTALLLIVDIAHQYEALEKLIDALVMPTTQHRLLKINEDHSIIEEEFYRGRRFEYPVSTLVLQFGNEVDKMKEDVPFQVLMDDLQKWIKHRYALSRFTILMEELIRKSDLIVQLEETDKLLLICPDTPSENLAVLASRIQNKFKESLDVEVVCGTASFPKDAPTFRAVMSKAEESLINASQAINILVD